MEQGTNILLLERHGNKCCICGIELHTNRKKFNSNDYINVDHIIPKSLGGSDDISNLRPMCRKCNSSRKNIVGQRRIEVLKNKIDDCSLERYNKIKFIEDDLNIGLLSEYDIEYLIDEYTKLYENNINALNKLLKK